MRLKFTLFSALTLGIILLVSCNKFQGKKSIVIKDCTGSYLQIDQSDFRICNEGKVDHIKNGTKVVAIFRTSKNCEADGRITCEMLHKYEDDIRISKITVR